MSSSPSRLPRTAPLGRAGVYRPRVRPAATIDPTYSTDPVHIRRERRHIPSPEVPYEPPRRQLREIYYEEHAPGSGLDWTSSKRQCHSPETTTYKPPMKYGNRHNEQSESEWIMAVHYHGKRQTFEDGRERPGRSHKELLSSNLSPVDVSRPAKKGLPPASDVGPTRPPPEYAVDFFADGASVSPVNFGRGHVEELPQYSKWRRGGHTPSQYRARRQKALADEEKEEVRKLSEWIPAAPLF